jgi:hypothetical protein
MADNKQLKDEVNAILDEHFGATPIPSRTEKTKVRHFISEKGRHKVSHPVRRQAVA